jgi:hypothetical protein
MGSNPQRCLFLVLAELVGLILAAIVTVAAYLITDVHQKIRITEAAPKDGHASARMDEGEFYFQFDKIFTLKMKSKSSAQLFQIGLLAVLFAVAFLIITYGMKNLGF